MSKSRGGLGRGLAALIPTGPATTTVSDVLMGGPFPGAGSPAVTSDRPAGEQVDARSHGTDGAQAATGGRANGDDPESRHGQLDQHQQDGRDASAPARDTEGVDADPGWPDGPHYQEVRVSQIRPNPRNPRTVFDEEALAELAHSIKEFGLLQPVVVRPLNRADHTGDAGDVNNTNNANHLGHSHHTGDADGAAIGYELVMGERRWRAAQRAGVDTIAAIVRRTEDADLLRDALLENIHRSNLNPLEEAAAYQQLLAEFDVTHEELATRLGRSRPVISNTIRLLGLPVPVQRRVAAGVLSAGHARALLSLSDPGDQEELAARIVAEGLSVRGTEEAVTMMGRRTPTRSRATPKRMSMPGVEDLATRLSDAYDTKVRVELGRRKGKIVVEFATVDDLERLVAIMAPQVAEKHGHQPSDVTSQ